MEKVKIYLPISLIHLIDNDCEAFDIRKKSGEVNRNQFLNDLLLHYFYTYRDTRQQQLDALRTVLHESAPMPASVELSAAARCLEVLSHRATEYSGTVHPVSLKPTKRTEPIIRYITQDDLGGSSISAFLRDMLASYAALPQSEREIIMFAEEYETIQTAIKNNRMIRFATRRTPGVIHDVNLYSVAPSKERLFTYVLCEEQGLISSYRLSRVNLPISLSAERKFSAESEEKFRRMLKYGPAFAINTLEDIHVRFTQEGLKKYQAIYTNRPDPVSVDGNEMIFECAREQLIRYLERLGAEAVVISPEDVREEINNYYKAALQAYSAR